MIRCDTIGRMSDKGDSLQRFEQFILQYLFQDSAQDAGFVHAIKPDAGDFHTRFVL